MCSPPGLKEGEEVTRETGISVIYHLLLLFQCNSMRAGIVLAIVMVFSPEMGSYVPYISFEHMVVGAELPLCWS